MSDCLNHASGLSLHAFEALLVDFSERSPDGVSILEEQPDYCLEEQQECDLVEVGERSPHHCRHLGSFCDRHRRLLMEQQFIVHNNAKVSLLPYFLDRGTVQ